MVLWESSTMYRQNLMNSTMQPPLPGGPGGPVPGRPPQDMSAPSVLGQSQFAGPPMATKQNFPGAPPPLLGQQNLSQTNSSIPPMNSSIQAPGGGPLPGQPPHDFSGSSMMGGQSQYSGPPMGGMKQTLPGPPLSGQHNLSQSISGQGPPPLSGPMNSHSGQIPSSSPLPGQQQTSGDMPPISGLSISPGPPLGQNSQALSSGPPMSGHSGGGPPLSGQQNSHPGGSPPLPGQQNSQMPPISGQQNWPSQQNHSAALRGSPLPGQQNHSAPPPILGQQNHSNSMRASPLPGQQIQSGPLGPPPMSVQQNLSNSMAGQQNPSNSIGAPPMSGHQNLSSSMGAPPPSLGQQNHSNSMRSSPLPGQQSLSGPLGGPPMSGQQNLSGPLGGPPMPGQQNLSGPVGAPPTSGQQTLSGPPLPGQQNFPGSIGAPPMSGHQNHSNSIGGLPLSGQQSLSSTMPPGQQNLSGPPPMSGQQNLSGPPPMSGQQNLSGPPPMSGQQNLSGPPMSGQQNLSGPPMSGQQNFTGPPPMSGQQNLSGPLGAPPMSGQQNLSGPLGAPPMSGQQNLSGPLGAPPMSGQQHFPSSIGAPPMPGQQNLSNTMPGPPGQQTYPGATPGSMHYAGQRTQQSLPSMQPHLANQNQYNQKYMGPPIPGQGVLRQQEPPMPYQQGYQNDMYANQRTPYQGGHQPAHPTHQGAYQSGYQQNPQQQQQQQQARRLDPDHMPSPIQVIQDDRRSRSGNFITNQKGLVPPLVTTNFTVQDQGNASPRFVRSTMYTVPTTTDIMKQTSVPFSLILSPMARVEDGEYEPPIVDMGEIGPVRCVRCKAYMSPFMQFIDSGRRFQCMFCKATTEVPSEYFQHLDHTGQRMDRYERPELMLGSYEFIATKDYCPDNKYPNPPAIIFIIDVTYNTIKSGLVNLICREMTNIIRNLPIDAGQTRTRMKVGFITYNNTVHFYNIKSCLAQPQMMVVGDVQDVFMPLLDGFLCDAEESLEVITSLMSQIPSMFADTRETETILAPAIQAGLEALKASECAGKLMVFHSSLPIAEAPGKLKNRDDRKLLGSEKEKTVLAPQNNVYNTLGQDCVAAGCSVDLFVFNNSYIDVATIGQVCRLTGGEIYKYTYFQADIDGDRLIVDVVNNISRPIAFNAVMRVRTSTGVRPTDFYGHFYMSNTTDMELASIDCDKAVAIEIKHDDKLAEEEGVFIQAALLYTSCAGVRRLRVINLSLKTSSQMAELYRACDLDAIINFFSKQGVFKLLEHSPKAVKENLISRCANMLAAYRKNCAAPSSAGQLILPECMKLLPLYVNCLMKSDAICGGADMTVDDRSYVMQAVSIMPVYTSVNYFYPRMLPLHNLDPQETDLPQMLRCSIDKITDDGCYLLENGIHMFLWLGLGLSSQWVQGVFGVPSVVQVDTDRTKIPIVDTPLNRRVNEIINCVRTDRHHCMRLTMVRQRDKLEMVFRHFLVEDKGADGSASYVDFLCHMHKEIRALLS